MINISTSYWIYAILRVNQHFSDHSGKMNQKRPLWSAQGLSIFSFPFEHPFLLEPTQKVGKGVSKTSTRWNRVREGEAACIRSPSFWLQQEKIFNIFFQIGHGGARSQSLSIIIRHSFPSTHPPLLLDFQSGRGDDSLSCICSEPFTRRPKRKTGPGPYTRQKKIWWMGQRPVH